MYSQYWDHWTHWSSPPLASAQSEDLGWGKQDAQSTKFTVKIVWAQHTVLKCPESEVSLLLRHPGHTAKEALTVQVWQVQCPYLYEPVSIESVPWVPHWPCSRPTPAQIPLVKPLIIPSKIRLLPPVCEVFLVLLHPLKRLWFWNGYRWIKPTTCINLTPST